jgi:cupin 2 domain-containing protein
METGFRRGRLPGADAAPPTGERVERLLARRDAAIDCIVSGRLEAPVAYRQAQDEWVVLLSGSARLRVGGDELDLDGGDWLFLPADLEHELLSTTPGSRWLAVFLEPA